MRNGSVAFASNVGVARHAAVLRVLVWLSNVDGPPFLREGVARLVLHQLKDCRLQPLLVLLFNVSAFAGMRRYCGVARARWLPGFFRDRWAHAHRTASSAAT